MRLAVEVYDKFGILVENGQNDGDAKKFDSNELGPSSGVNVSIDPVSSPNSNEKALSDGEKALSNVEKALSGEVGGEVGGEVNLKNAVKPVHYL